MLSRSNKALLTAVAAATVTAGATGTASATVPTAELSVCSNTAQDYGFYVSGKNQDDKTVKSVEDVVEGLQCYTLHNWWWKVNSPITVHSSRVPQYDDRVVRVITIPSSYTNKLYKIKL